MVSKIYTEPTIEPVTLLELKSFLRIDSTDFADDLTSVQSIFPGDHIVAASYSLVGTGVDVLGYQALVLLESGTNGASGTVDVKLQDSDDNVTYTDVASGAFTQVTEATDNATFEKAYTGTKQYLRVVATVGTATCDFGVSILKKSPTSAEDDLLNNYIKAARIRAEELTNRAFITQTWIYYLDVFPSGRYIQLPYAPLQTITSLIYTDSVAVANTFAVSNYDADTNSEPGRLILKYGLSWASATLAAMNPIAIKFVCGYGSTTASVPEPIRIWIRGLAAYLYENREQADLDKYPLGILRNYRVMM